MYVYIYVCIYIYVCMYVCIYLYIYIYHIVINKTSSHAHLQITHPDNIIHLPPEDEATHLLYAAKQVPGKALDAALGVVEGERCSFWVWAEASGRCWDNDCGTG